MGKGKNLVDYDSSDDSDSENKDTIGTNQKQVKSTQNVTKSDPKSKDNTNNQKKRIVNLHNKPLMKNNFKFLNSDGAIKSLENEIDALKEYGVDQNAKNNVIMVETLSGKKSLNLPEISQKRESLKKKKLQNSGDPYYYSVMREIYNTDEIIDKAISSKVGTLPENLMDKKDFSKDFTEEEKQEYSKNWGGKMDTNSGQNINIKEVNAKDLTDFDWRKYKANLDKTTEKMEQKNILRPNFEQKRRNQLNTMAFELIEHEEIHGEGGLFNGTAFKRGT